MIGFMEEILRIFITFILSFSFGMWRQRGHKPVGFGTFTFVSVGACALAIVALKLGEASGNPLPLLAAIVTGIGFLGAGALVRTSDKIFGFTTAATIWVFSIFGLLIGAGEYFVGIIVYVLILVVFFYDKHLEHSGVGSYQKKITITTNRIIEEKKIRNILTKHSVNFKPITVDVNKKEKKITSTYFIEGKRHNLNQIPKILYKEDWLDDCKIE